MKAESSPSPHYIVLLTATIAPRQRMQSLLVRTDRAQRLADYEVALRSWLRRSDPWLKGIVFAENSGSSLKSLEAIAEKENPRKIPVEFIRFDFPEPPEGLHYGYSELILVREAVKVSRLLQESTHFIKATGRYRFPNISKLVRSLPPRFQIAVDCKLGRVLKRDRHYWTHFALAIFERRFFEEFISHLPEKMVPAPPWNRSQFVESVIYDEVVLHRHKPGVIMRWTCNCEPLGHGANGDDYGSLKKHLQSLVRAVGRRIYPSLWL